MKKRGVIRLDLQIDAAQPKESVGLKRAVFFLGNRLECFPCRPGGWCFDARARGLLRGDQRHGHFILLDTASTPGAATSEPKPS